MVNGKGQKKQNCNSAAAKGTDKGTDREAEEAEGTDKGTDREAEEADPRTSSTTRTAAADGTLADLTSLGWSARMLLVCAVVSAGLLGLAESTAATTRVWSTNLLFYEHQMRSQVRFTTDTYIHNGYIYTYIRTRSLLI
jgi:hypothetical protein